MVLCVTAPAVVMSSVFAEDRTTPVTVSGTPNVVVTNAPTVSISPTNNTVQTTSKTSTVQLWTTDQVIANGGSISSAQIDCTGYKEIRVVLFANSSSAGLTARVGSGTSLNGGSFRSLGYANFATPGVTSTGQAKLQLWPNSC